VKPVPAYHDHFASLCTTRAVASQNEGMHAAPFSAPSVLPSQSLSGAYFSTALAPPQTTATTATHHASMLHVALFQCSISVKSVLYSVTPSRRPRLLLRPPPTIPLCNAL
jgi:hypothetical protein